MRRRASLSSPIRRLASLAESRLSRSVAIEEVRLKPPNRHFGEQRVRPWLAAALDAANFRKPMAVQAMAMDRIAHHEDTVIHAATGSGKTLAYLVPTLSRLDPGVPLQLLVLVPSRELAAQVAYEAHQLLKAKSQLHVALVVGNASTALQMQQDLARQVDACRAEVVVATPEALTRVLTLNSRSGAGRSGDKATGTLRTERTWVPPHVAAREAAAAAAAAEAEAKAVAAVDDLFQGWPEAFRERAKLRLEAEAQSNVRALEALQTQGGARGNSSSRAEDGSVEGGRSLGAVLGAAEADAAVGARLLRSLGTNLDAVVLDEVDALLPKPLVKEGVGYYRQRDWAKAGRLKRRAARVGAPSSSPAAKLLARILASALRLRDTSARASSAGRGARASAWHAPARSWRAWDDAPNPPVQLIAASATVGRSLLLQLKELFGREKLPTVVGESGEVHEKEGSPRGQRGALGRALAAGHAGPSHGARGVASVSVPATITHRVLRVPSVEAQPVAVARALMALRPRACLVVLSPEASVTAWAAKLRATGLPNVELLHEALGFSSRRLPQAADGDGAVASASAVTGARAAPPAAGLSTAQLLEAVGRVRRAPLGEAPLWAPPGEAPLPRRERATRGAAAAETQAESGALGTSAGRAGTESVTKSAHGRPADEVADAVAAEVAPTAGGASDAAAAPMRVLLTTERSARGLDLAQIDCVVMLYVPLTSDTYVHLSGRTGRGAQGVALTVVCEDEAKKLGLFSSQLGISIRPVQENAEGLVF